MTEPNQSNFEAELRSIREELRAIEEGANQRYAEITAKIAKETVRGTSPPAKTPARTAQEAVRGTIGKGEATTLRETPPNPTQDAKIEGDKALQDIGNDNPIEDWQPDKNQKENQGSNKRTFGERIRDWRERAAQNSAAKQAQLKLDIEADQKQFAKDHPRLAKLNEGVRKAGSIGLQLTPVSHGKRILDIGIRVVENRTEIEEVIKNAPKYGKDIRVWIKDAQKEANSLTNRLFRRENEQPFFLREDATTKKIQDKISNLEGVVKDEKSKSFMAIDKTHLTDETIKGKPDQTFIDKINKQIGTLEGKKTDLQDSLYYQISKEAHAQDFSKSFGQYVDTKVLPNASEHVGNYLIGTAQERYHHYLHNAVHHLGEKHFDLSFHPKNGLNFDKFASSRLFQDGYHPQAIESVLKDSPFRSIFAPKGQENPPLQGIYQKWLNQYDQRTSFYTPKNEAIRENVAAFQKDAKGKILEGKVNPHDVLFHENLSEQLKNWQVTRRGEILKEVEHTAREYSAYKGQIPGEKDATAAYQYRLEMSRWSSQGHHLDKSHDLIGANLTKAGFPHQEIEETFRLYHPSLNESKKQAQEFFSKNVMSRLSEPKHLEEWDKVDGFKAQQGLTSERRLDRLDLDKSYKHLDEHHPAPSPPQSIPRTQEQNLERDR